jgi:acyl-CoA reductase-like NAD-dependent aldehyde dehydrogenase
MSELATPARRGLVIGDETVPASGNEYLDAIDPASGEAFAEIPRALADDVDRAVARAREALPAWRALAPAERGRALLRVGAALLAHRDELARLETRDTGKPLTQAYADVDAAARYFEFYAGLADKILGTTIPLGDGMLDYTTREPLGVSAQIVPWNYPLQIGGRGIACPLAAGNTVVVKPAEDASVSLLRVAELALDAGMPPGVVNVVTGLGAEAGAALAEHPGIDQLTFTGSVETGIAVTRAAAGNVVPVTLELGGKCPVLVFEDADLEAAAPVVLKAIIQHAGQTCSAASRVIVAEPVHDELVERIAALAARVRIGAGLDDPDLGPLITERQLSRVKGFVDGAVADGATVVSGGGVADAAAERGGYFFEPTVVDGVDPGMHIASEEVFGPVLSVLTAADEDEAVARANATRYGLVSGVWTKDISRAHRVAARLDSGQVFVNAYGAGGGIELPFGGYKHSGHGREKGIEGLNSYLQTKNVCVKL